MRALRVVGRIVLIVLMILFTGVGVTMAVTGRGGERLIGVACALLFGASGLVFLVVKRRRPEAALRIAMETAGGAPQQAVQVPVRMSKWVGTVLGLGAMAAACILLGAAAGTVADPGESPAFIQLIGFGGGALFSSIALAHLASLTQGRARLVLLDHGVLMIGGPAPSYVPWAVMERVGFWELQISGHVQKFIGIRVTDATAIRRPLYSKLLMTGNRKMSGWDVTYTENLFDIRAEELTLLLQAFLHQPDLRRAAWSLPVGPLSFEQFASATRLETAVRPDARPMV